MDYREYKRLKSKGLISSGIPPSVAFRLIRSLPTRYKYTHIFFTWAWMLSIPAAIVLMIHTEWWVGLLVLFFITPAIFSGNKQSAIDSVLEYAEDNKEYYDFLVSKGLLVFKRTDE